MVSPADSASQLQDLAAQGLAQQVLETQQMAGELHQLLTSAELHQLVTSNGGQLDQLLVHSPQQLHAHVNNLLYQLADAAVAAAPASADAGQVRLSS